MTDTLATAASASMSVPQERKVVTAIPGPKSQAIHERRTKVVAAGAASGFPIYVDHAHGAILVDVDGNQFIDLGSGIGVTTIGHTDDGVVAAASRQVGELTHGLFTITPYEGYVRVAELLAAHTPGDFAKKTVLVNAGAEAVENGVKIARKYTGRKAVAVLDHAFHGRTNLTMAMNYKAMPYGLGFGPFASDIHHAPNSYPYHDGLSGAEAAARTIAFLEKTVGAEDLACLVAEPIQGEGGFMVPAEGYLNALQKWCTEKGVVFIADEIQSGMARTGKYFASEHFGLVPDLVLSAKGIAGGLPLAAVTGRAEIMDAAHPGGLGGTFGGNPVSTAAAIAVFEAIEKGNLLGEAKRIENTLKTELLRLQAKFPIIGDVRGLGAMIAMEFVMPGTENSTKEPNAAAVSALSKHAFENGVILLTAGTYGNVIRFLPSLAVSDALILDAVGVIEDALARL
ncbi:MAG: 4-aminobutyrate--2-oxoglutarate transaminase [Cryobacterium sp.]|nr:4-aminobutyrate--2-oxoglutarate transaminase [Cryobacterium sp.]MBX3090363.1 4-aminobutyrate--2-oxoglutarate transaminase [Cryobacterium sp.]MBX3116844.1 4-aminobutyrate--2-oxoglutarate transaminase [Cryobacterium sp.]MCC7127740.1 4-aminobutyrate--2-oxoglutarate transaminase [Microbacteriaceae bacterium]MCO5293708.1 4-aminobutyrate--2-oxoglutarate transaminase [Homoserinimonas sp.]